MRITTLPAKWQFVMLAATLYVTAPVVEAVYYQTQDARGTYPANADSIGIPIAAFALALLVISPVYALLVWGATRSYRGGRSLWTLDRTRPAWSVLWSVVLGGLIVYAIGDAVYSTVRFFPVDCLADVLWAYLLACLRSSLTRERDSPQPTT